jgi:4'-phosphopantetheinyl transferase
VKALERLPGTGLHLWHARLDAGDWPKADGLPPAERARAERLLRTPARRRWVSSRWALRSVLARYLGEWPAEIELRLGERGKPLLADAAHPLRFNLSHSDELATIAVAERREVGVDVQRLGPRPAAFYSDWTRREAIAKCHGVGLGTPLPGGPVVCLDFDLGAGFAATVAIAAERLPTLRHLAAGPALAQ